MTQESKSRCFVCQYKLEHGGVALVINAILEEGKKAMLKDEKCNHSEIG